MAQYCVEHPTQAEMWHRHSNFLVVVSVPDEVALLTLDSLAWTVGLSHEVVREPDYENSVTAVVLAPGPMARKLCAEFPLALKRAPALNEGPQLHLQGEAVSP
jgi:peptidyl-tRNA hydrolase